MERHGRAADFIDQFLTDALQLFQIRRTKLRIGCSWENQVSDFQIAHRPVIGRRLRINLFGDAKRSFAYFIIWPNVPDDCRINSVAINNQRIIAGLGRIFAVRERSRNHDVGIGRADEKAEFLERGHFRTKLGDHVPEIAFTVR